MCDSAVPLGNKIHGHLQLPFFIRVYCDVTAPINKDVFLVNVVFFFGLNRTKAIVGFRLLKRSTAYIISGLCIVRNIQGGVLVRESSIYFRHYKSY